MDDSLRNESTASNGEDFTVRLNPTIVMDDSLRNDIDATRPAVINTTSNFWLRLRMNLPANNLSSQCNTPQSRWKWIFVIYGLLWFHMCSTCPLMALRALLHIQVSLFAFLAIASFARVLVMRKCLSNRETLTEASAFVMKSKETKSIRFILPSKTIHWIKFEDEMEAAGADLEGTHADSHPCCNHEDADSNSQSYDVKYELNDAHCVIAGPQDGIGVGDVITVNLIDNDRNNAIYLPYQSREQKRFLIQALYFLIFSLVAIVILVWCMGVPLIATSEQVEQAAEESWICDDNDDRNDETIRENDPTTIEDAANRCCRIDWHQALSYNLTIPLPICISTGYGAYIVWRARKGASQVSTRDVPTAELSPLAENFDNALVENRVDPDNTSNSDRRSNSDHSLIVG